MELDHCSKRSGGGYGSTRARAESEPQGTFSKRRHSKLKDSCEVHEIKAPESNGSFFDAIHSLYTSTVEIHSGGEVVDRTGV